MGAAYDDERGLKPYGARGDFGTVRAFFDERCCYCGTPFGAGVSANQDHLIPINKADLGLHAWGNVVPACQACNNRRQRKDWRDFIIERAGENSQERHARVRDFLTAYDYAPSVDLRAIAEELYEEMGDIAMTLVKAKIKRVRGNLQTP